MGIAHGAGGVKCRGERRARGGNGVIACAIVGAGCVLGSAARGVTGRVRGALRIVAGRVRDVDHRGDAYGRGGARDCRSVCGIVVGVALGASARRLGDGRRRCNWRRRGVGGALRLDRGAAGTVARNVRVAIHCNLRSMRGSATCPNGVGGLGSDARSLRSPRSGADCLSGVGGDLRSLGSDARNLRGALRALRDGGRRGGVDGGGGGGFSVHERAQRDREPVDVEHERAAGDPRPVDWARVDLRGNLGKAAALGGA